MAKQKKKATGMSQRVSFLDRSVIAENKAILRYNEDLEKAARREHAEQTGEPMPPEPRRERPDRADRGERRPPRSGAPRPARPPRPAREPVAGETELVAAGEATEWWAEFRGPGRRMITLLLRIKKPGVATVKAWDDIAAKQSPEVDWDGVRTRWAVVRDGVLAQFYVLHPDLAPKPVPPKKKPRPKRRRPKKPPTPSDLAGSAHPPTEGDEQAPVPPPDVTAEPPPEPAPEATAEPTAEATPEPAAEPTAEATPEPRDPLDDHSPT